MLTSLARAAGLLRELILPAVRARRAAGLLLLGGLVACDIPTGLPRFHPRVGVPVEATRLGVGQLVPAGVTVTSGSFGIGVSAAAGSRSLAQMCGTPCTALQGQQAPKPAFTHSFAASSAMPAGLTAATLSGGEAAVTLTHSFAYDPLRPPGSTQNGVLRVVLRSADRELGRDSITSFPGQVSRVIPLLPGPVNGAVNVEISIVSPAGSAVTINTASAITATVQPRGITASSAEVTVQNRAVAAEPVALDLTRIDDDLRDRVQSGTLIVALDNPFTVAGALELRLHVPNVVEVRQTVQLVTGASTTRVELTLEQVRALLGRTVEISLSGVVSQTAGPVTVLPTHAITVSPIVNLILEIGS